MVRLEPAGFFVLRTPLLPLADFVAWGDGAAGGNDLDADAHEDATRRARQGLRDLVAMPVVREAIFLASPDLDAAIDTWLDAPLSDRGQRAERALVRYVARMAARATPFGLFAGCSVGSIDGRTEVRLRGRDRYRRHTRLDMEYLAALIAELESIAAIRERLVYRPNATIYRAAGRIRYVEAALRDRARSHRLVAVDDADHVRATLERAHDGATVAALAAPLVAEDISRDDATTFIHQLIDAQLLVSDLEPCVTGCDPLQTLIEKLEALGPATEQLRAITTTLVAAQQGIELIDREPVGGLREAYRGVAAQLESLPASVDLQRLFQVDMTKPVDTATVGPEVVVELERAARLLHVLTRAPRDTALDRFRERFVARYEGQEVALDQALDEEAGIGFEASTSPAAEASPLLRDLAFPPTVSLLAPVSPAASLLTRKLAQTLRDGAGEMAITLDEVMGLMPNNHPPLPPSLAVNATLAASGTDAFRSGDFRVLVHSVVGPSGARMLGRFCAADPGLEQHVHEHLAHEERLEPAAVFAEIVHLPEGRVGNVVQRPRLRRHEIPYLGRSAASADCQIPVSDLLVSVRGGRVRLRSRRLGCDVVPRLTSAHNYRVRSVGMYSFLCALQDQDVHGQLMWDWGPLSAAPYLPRVVSGRLVLTRARWRLGSDDIASLDHQSGRARYAAMQSLRTRLRLPAIVLLVEADNTLFCDLGNPLSVETLIHLIQRRTEAVLTEVFPSPDELWVQGPEGRFVSEVIVPLQTAADTAGSRGAALRSPVVADRVHFAPGSEWLFLKIYCGTASADTLLRDLVGPVVRDATANGVIDRWFFIRYGDPDWHLRVRMHGDPSKLAALLVDMHQLVQPLLANGSVVRLAVDTYEPEAERYGGAQALPLIEAMFEADSEAALAILGLTAGDAGMEMRWRLALRGSDMVLEDLGLGAADRALVVRQLRDAYRNEFRVDATLRRQIGQRYRVEAPTLLPLLRRDDGDNAQLWPAFDILTARSARIQPLARELASLDALGQLTCARSDIAKSLVHMHVNRLLRSAQRAHELVLYDFLDRIHMSLRNNR